jgi:uncharacterized membrane protein
MIELYVYPFTDRFHAWEVHAALMREPYGFLAEAGDVAIVGRGTHGLVRLARVEELGTASNEFPWRGLISALLAPSDVVASPAWNAAFATTLRARLGPDTSALFVLRRQFAPEAAFEQLSRYAGVPLRTLLGDEALSAIAAFEG